MTQPAWGCVGSPPGASITPSRVMNSVTISLLIGQLQVADSRRYRLRRRRELIGGSPALLGRSAGVAQRVLGPGELLGRLVLLAPGSRQRLLGAPELVARCREVRLGTRHARRGNFAPVLGGRAFRGGELGLRRSRGDDLGR